VKQFVLPSPPNADGIVHLYEKDYHYLVRVRRLREGSFFRAVLPAGADAGDGGAAAETEVEVLSTVDNILVGRCGGVLPAPVSSQLPPIYLFQGLPRGNKMDLIVRQAAEGGITEVMPFLTEYSSVKAAAGFSEKLKRWERIIREARQQSGSPVATVVRSPATVDGLLARWAALKAAGPGGVGLFLHQDPLAQGTFHDYLYGKPDFVVLAVGPEGGFSPDEARRFTQAGFAPLVMGATILRTETAALYGAAAVRIILLENASWTPKTPKPISPPASVSNS
jgi:16S rRNA (uracil1498-N3)-methyltransferase